MPKPGWFQSVVGESELTGRTENEGCYATLRGTYFDP